MTTCTRYNCIWWGVSVTSDRSIVFSRYFVSPNIKLTATVYNYNIVKCDVKYLKHKHYTIFHFDFVLLCITVHLSLLSLTSLCCTLQQQNLIHSLQRSCSKDMQQIMKSKFGTFILSALYFYRFRVIPIYLCKIYVVVFFCQFWRFIKKNLQNYALPCYNV